MVKNEPAWTAKTLASPHDLADKASRVRTMFNAIAPRYELVNALFSAGRDGYWRRRAVELAGVGPDDTALDIACGTGDLSRAFAKARSRFVLGCDFAHQMLTRASGAGGNIRWCEADALRLPFPSETFTVTGCAFGVRNFGDLQAGLAEMYRVLKPGGRAVILEFTRPTNRIARRLYEVYANGIMPTAASWISGDKTGAYRYLPRSVVSFLDAERMRARLLGAGFGRCDASPLTAGVVTVYVASRE